MARCGPPCQPAWALLTGRDLLPKEPIRGHNNSNFKKNQNRETVTWWSKGGEEFYKMIRSWKPREEAGNKKRHPQPGAGEAQWDMKGGQWETVSNERPGGVHLFR